MNFQSQPERGVDTAFALDQPSVRQSDQLPKPWRGLWRVAKGIAGTAVFVFIFLPVVGLVLLGTVIRAWAVALRRRAAGRPISARGGRGFWSRPHLGHVVRLGICELCLAQVRIPRARRGLIWRFRQALSEVATVLLYLPYAQRPIVLFEELSAAYGGKWFPFGDGVTVASHADVAAWLSRGDVLKRGQTLGWPSSDGLVGYSRMSLIFLSSAPGTADHDIWVKAKRLVITWLNEAWSVSPRREASADALFRERPWLPGLLRLVPRQASRLPDRSAVWRAYGETQFYLLTQGGQLSREERRAFVDRVANPAPFFSNFFNFLLGGSALERKGVASFDAIRAALYRRRDCSALTATLAEASRMGVEPNELLRLFTIIFGFAGAPAPPKFAHAVISRLYSDPERMVPLWRKNPRGFLLECARLDKLVPIVSVNTNDRFTLELPLPDVFDARGEGPRMRTVEMTPELPIRLCYSTANQDPAVFPEPDRFDPARQNLDEIVSWNSPAASARHHAATKAGPACPHAAKGDDETNLLPELPAAFAPRYCAGRDWGLDVIEFVVERFMPAIAGEAVADTMPANATDALLNRALCGSFDYPLSRHVPQASTGADPSASREAQESRRARMLNAALDSYTRVILRLMGVAVLRWNDFAPRGIDLTRPAKVDLRVAGPKGRGKGKIGRGAVAFKDSGGLPVNQLLAGSPKHSVEVMFGRLLTPTWDEDIPEGFPFVRRFLRRLVNSPLVSNEELRDLHFPPDDTALGWKRTMFASGLPGGRQAFEELHSDDVMTKLAFAGPACHLTKRLPGAGEAADPSISLLALQHAPADAVFVHDVSELHAFPVRAPYERYGAIAYFDAQYCPLGIWWCHGDRFVPAASTNAAEQEAWRYAKYVWRATWFVHVTVVDHLTGCHLVAANALTAASRVQLPAEHPLRIFLKPFTFHTASINFQASRSLVNPTGMFVRVWGFDYPTLEKVVDHVMQTRLRGGAGGWACDYNFPTWRRNTCHPSMRDVPDSIFPLRRDLEEYWAIVRGYVANFVALYYPPATPGALPSSTTEPELHAFLRTLSGSLGVPFPGDWDQAIDVLTHAIVTVSAWHKHTGVMVDYIARPDWIGCKLQGLAQETVQTWTQLLALVSVTGIKMPGMLDDFSHLWADREDERRAEMLRLAGDFRWRLQEFDAAIFARNLERRHVLWTMAPQFMDCSVGS